MNGVRFAAGLALFAALLAPAPAAHAVMADDPAPAATVDADFEAGRKAIERKQWAEAVRLLKQAEVRHPVDADLHNGLGYAYRHLQQFELAFAHYKRALAIDPRHRGAHEYIGEAYLMVGDIAGAERHLAELRAICLLGCEELGDLERAIARHRGAVRR